MGKARTMADGPLKGKSEVWFAFFLLLDASAFASLLEDHHLSF
jgi:hypothetical protein